LENFQALYYVAKAELVNEVFGKNVMSRTQIFEWHKRMKNGCEKVEDDPKSGQPSMSKTDDNIARVKQLVRNDSMSDWGRTRPQ